MRSAEEFWDTMDIGSVPAIAQIEARDAEWRRLVEEAQQRSATWQHNHEDALRSVDEARADAKRNALSNIELRIEVDRLKGELAEARDCGGACGTVGHQCQECLRKMFLREVARREDAETKLAEARRLIEEIPGTFTPGGWIKRRDAFLAAPPADATTESRSVQRRKAAQKSEPAPTFAARPTRHGRWGCGS